MYPLNMTRNDGASVGYAVANDEAEHRALSEAGYEPKLIEAEEEKRKPGRPRKGE